MPHHLNAPLYLPLEREHEAWVIRGIEDYAVSVGLRCRTFAVSQKEEDPWGADEVVGFTSKVFGLQFKRPYVLGGKIYWEIDPGSQQFKNICANKEIFYALPSFVNRTLKYQALHHCFFWRPCESCADEVPSGGVQKCLTNKMRQYRENFFDLKWRWGDFSEELFSCNAGIRLDAEASIGSVLSEIQVRLRAHQGDDRLAPVGEPSPEEILVLVALELRS